MAGYSKVIMVGNLTRDPELKYLGSGTAVTNFSVAVNRKWKKDGVEKEEVSFIDCTAWARTAEGIAEHFEKGKPILVEGHLKQESWDDAQTGAKRSKLKVVVEAFQFVGGKRSDSESGGDTPAQSGPEDVPF